MGTAGQAVTSYDRTETRDSGYRVRSNKTGTRTEQVLCPEVCPELAYVRQRGDLLELCIRDEDGFKIYLLNKGQITNMHVETAGWVRRKINGS